MLSSCALEAYASAVSASAPSRLASRAGGSKISRYDASKSLGGREGDWHITFSHPKALTSVIPFQSRSSPSRDATLQACIHVHKFACDGRLQCQRCVASRR